jgi:hypothetical protein
LNHPVDVVGGIYPQRRDPIVFNVRTAAPDVYPVDPKTGLIDVLGLHTGFLRITRRAAQMMTDHYKSFPANQGGTYDRNGTSVVGLFDPYVPTGTQRKLGDDYAFCQRWVDLGGKCWLDASFNMGHIGLKICTGQFGQFVEKDKAA